MTDAQSTPHMPPQALWVPAEIAAAAVENAALTVQWVLDANDPDGLPELSNWESRRVSGLDLLICPICAAPILDDDILLRRHEQWHANNDFPITFPITPANMAG